MAMLFCEKKSVKIIQRYIAQGVLMSTAIVFVVVLALSFIVGLLRELHDIGVGEYGFSHAIVYVLLQLPHTVYQLFPLLVLVGGVLGLGLLSASHELMVMRIAGTSVWKIIGGVISVALIMIFFMMILGEWVGPHAEKLAEKHKSTALSNGQAVKTRYGTWIHEGNNFLHIDRMVGHSRLEGVTRYEFDEGHHLLASYYVKSLDLVNGQWILNDLAKTLFTAGGTKSDRIATGTWNLRLTPNLLNVGIVEPDSMSLPELIVYSRTLEKNHLEASEFRLAFWQRVFQPLAILVMILLAVPFVFAAPRSVSIGRQILFAIIVGFGFYILTGLLGQLSIVCHFPPLVAALLPIVMFGGAGYAMMISLRGLV